MKRLLIIPILLISFTTANAQLNKFITDWQAQLTVSPYSIDLWGSTPATSKITASYGMFEVIWFHGFKTLYDTPGLMKNSHKVSIFAPQMRIMDKGKQASDYRYGGNYFSIFINPIQYHFWKFSITGGIGWFFRKLPDVRGRHLNFQLQLTYQIKDWIGISWSHVSSGFHIFTDVNPGVDNISIVISFLNN